MPGAEQGYALQGSYQFGDFSLESASGCLLRNGVRQSVEPKALRLLEILIEGEGALIDREALVDRLWGTVVVTPGTLTRLVAQLRRILEDDVAHPRYIGTVHTRGYRWLAKPARPNAISGAPWQLPQRLIRLIGRDADLRAMDSLLAGGTRLLTLVGPGGAGKTQLALESGRRYAQQFPASSVVWIDLSSATDALSCGRTVATAVGAREYAEVPLERSIALVLGERQLLMILDNCERVVAPVTGLAGVMLARCPGLSIVCTSQTTLDVPEEVLHWVKPLGLPDAVQLFLERARAVVPEFALDEANAQAVTDICRRLDGLPLALELAAPRLAALTPGQLHAALEHRFSLLTRQGAHLGQRHSSLQAAIEWSFGLLQPAERELLELCGVFAGTWSIEAAQAVAGLERAALLNLIHGLVQRSLLAVERVGDTLRYRLLDSVCAFVRLRLDASSHQREIRGRHARFFARLATAANVEMIQFAPQLVCLARLRLEWTNLIAAFEWSCEEPQFRDLAVELITGLRWEFWIAGRFIEGDRRLRKPLEWFETLPDTAKAPLLNGHALIVMGMSDYPRASQLAEDAALHAERSGQRWEQCWGYALKSWVDALSGRPGDSEIAAARSLAAGVGLDDPWLRAAAEVGLSLNALIGGNAADALQRLTPLCQSAAQPLDRMLHGYASMQRALALFILGDRVGSRAELAHTARLTAAVGSARTGAGCCELMAYLAASDADHERAAWLLGAAMTGREIAGGPLAPQWEATHAMTTALLRHELGAEACAQAISRGRRSVLTESFAVVEAMLR